MTSKKDKKAERKAKIAALQREELAKLEPEARKQGYTTVEAYVTVRKIEALEAHRPLSQAESELEIMRSSTDLYALAREFGKLGENYVIPLIQALQMPNPLQRQCACNALGLLGDQRAVESLCKMVRDPEPMVRQQAALALGYLKNQSALNALEVFSQDSDEYVRKMASEALILIGANTSLTAFAKQLTDDDNEVRKLAAKGLSKMDNPAVIDYLVPALADPQYGAAFYAKQGLKKFSQAEDKVVAALDGKGRYLRQFAVELLGHYKNPKAIPVITGYLHESKNKEIRKIAAEALGRIKHTDCVPELIKALSDPEQEVIEAVVKALNKLKSVEAVPAIISCIPNGGFNTVAIAEVYKLFGKVGTDEAIDFLVSEADNRKNLDSDDAALALCNIKNKNVIPHLEKLLKSNSQKVKVGAQKQLARLRK